MAALIAEIVRSVLLEAAAHRTPLTPDNYHSLFCQKATQLGLSVPECKRLDGYIAKLDPAYRAELKRLNVRSEGELFAYIASRLNRLNPTEQARLLQQLISLIKHMAAAGAKLHNTEIRTLCAVSIDTINKRLSQPNLATLNDKWVDFLVNYSDDFLKKLDSFGVKTTDDIQTIIKKILSNNQTATSDSANMAAIAGLLTSALTPSLALAPKEQRQLEAALKDDPLLLNAANTQDKIRQNIAKRVQLDGEELLGRVAILKSLLDEINEQISGFNSDFAASSDAFRGAKSSLESEEDYSQIKSKLIAVITGLQDQIDSVTAKLSDKEKTIESLKSKIGELQNQKSTGDLRTDKLTNLGSKYGLEAELVGVESIYLKYSLDFCVCFFGIDDFKNITQKYGEDSGDIILSTVGKILKDQSPQNSFVARYDGVSFAVLLANTSIDEAVDFAQKVIDSLAGFKFLYKGDNIHITASCGVASRRRSKSETDVLKKAIFGLFEAKDSGQNCVRAS